MASEEGQSTIEFALSLILLLAFILFYFQLTMIFAFGSYVHYATFMSARAYMASSRSEEDQRSRARDVIVIMLKKSIGQSGVDKFPHIAKGVGGGDPGGFQVDRPSQYNKSTTGFSWLEGVRYTFQGKLFLIPLGGTSKAATAASTAPTNAIRLTSESWLGREPSNEDCVGYMGKSSWIYDNGC